MTVLPANRGLTSPVPASRPPRLALLRTPKVQVLVVLLALGALASPFEGGLAAVGGPVLTAVAVACLADLLLVHQTTRRWHLPLSALITGLIVSLVLAPLQSSWLVPGFVSLVAILSKHVVRSRREHLLNPAAVGLLAAGVILGAPQSWWGALADLPALLVVALILAGAVVVEKLNKLPLVLVFLGAYFALWTCTSFTNPVASAEMFRPPFLQSALFLALFMLTDPPTSPSLYDEQVWFGLVAAGAAWSAQLLGAGQVYLLVGVLAANTWLALTRWLRRRSTNSERARGSVRAAGNPPAARYTRPAQTVASSQSCHS